MKIRPLYLYGGIAAAAILFLLLFSVNDGTINQDSVINNRIPDDDVHKGLENPVQTPPGKENVSNEIIQKMEILKKEVEKNPEDTLKMKEYADLLAAAHHSEEAVIYYYNILNINPRRTDILSNLAFIYFNKNDFEKASDLTGKILLYEPDNTQAMYNLGAIAATSGNKAEAKKRWEELIAKFPDSEESKLAENSLRKL